MTPRLFYICGTDGAGKSTQADLVARHLRAAGVPTEHVWLRFPFLFSVPLVVYARLRGWSWYEHTGDVKHGYWDFRRSPLLRALLPWTLLLDAVIAAVPRVFVPLRRGRTIVCERFVLDMLVDLSVALGDPALHRTLPGRLFPRLLPPNTGVAVLDLDAATIRTRRADLRVDRRLEQRLAQFRTLADDLGLPIIRSEGSIDDVNATLEATLRAQHEKPRHTGYGKVRSATLERALRVPLVAVASHWAVQSLTYMDRSERAFKLLLDGMLTLLLGLTLRHRLGRVGAWSAALLGAHTLNFLFNGHLWGILKHYALVHTTYQDFMAYYEALRRRVEAEPSIRFAGVYGSLARENWKPSSDLDVRMIRQPGWQNGWRACWFTLLERARALVRGFPMDIYVVDSQRALDRMHLETTPTVLVDRAGR